jgi:hypothetical protein
MYLRMFQIDCPCPANVCQKSKRNLQIKGKAAESEAKRMEFRPPSFQLIFQILPEATLHQLLPESRF